MSKLTQGWTCSQLMVSRYAETEGWNLGQLIAVSYPLNGGIIQGGRCGAVYGAYMVLGMYTHEWAEASNSERWQLATAMIARFNQEFVEENGALVCRELLGHDWMTVEGREALHRTERLREVCPKAVQSAMDIVDALVAENQSV